MKAVFAGTFDPFTIGHLEVVQKAVAVFDKVVIGVALDTGRQSQAPIEKRIEIVKKSIADINYVSVVPFGGLLTDFLKQQNTTFLIRGLRSEKDFLPEQSLAEVYRSQKADINPVYFLTSPKYSYVSSGIVRELLKLNGDVSGFVCSRALSLIKTTYVNT